MHKTNMHFNLSRSPLIKDIGSYTGLLLNKLDVSSSGIQYIRFVRFVICWMKLLSSILRSEEQVARLIVGGLYYRQTTNMCSRAALSQQKRGADRGKPWTFHTSLKFMEVTTALIPYLQRHPRLFCSPSEPSHSHGQLFSHTFAINANGLKLLCIILGLLRPLQKRVGAFNVQTLVW